MINTAIEASKEAGKILMEKRGLVNNINVKDDSSLVSEVDIACEEKIRKIIGSKYPNHGFLGEEEGITNEDSEYLWIIDPLDGTHNYIYGSHLFGVSIALAHNKEIVLGVVFFPVINQLFTSEKDKGSFLNGKRLKVKEKELNKSFVSFSSKYFSSDSEKRQKVGKELLEQSFETRITGCASYNIINVATNLFGAWLSPRTKIWDIAAGKLVVEEAGGIVTDFDGNPIKIDSKNVLAANKTNHKKILEILK